MMDIKEVLLDGYQRGLASVVYKCFDKASALTTDKYAKAGGVNN